MRIVTGSLKGRVIPFTSRRHGDVRITASRLRESLFATLGADLDATAFLDMCAGSGQMALEAASRGARTVAAEPDRRRYESLKKLVAEWKVEGMELTNSRAENLIDRLGERGEEFDGIFIDPPYDATNSGEPLSVVLLRRIDETGLCAPGGLVAVQHSKRLEHPERSGSLHLQRQRKFGDSLLSLYELESA